MMLISIIIVITFLVFVVSLVLYKFNTQSFDYSMKYECGFNNLNTKFYNFYFPTRYYSISLAFLVFDIEIMFMICFPQMLVSTYNLSFLFMMILILLLGMYYEWYKGCLDWKD